MSSIALLNQDGTFRKKLHLTSLPENYMVPDGIIVSWKMESIIKATMSPVEDLYKKEPIEAHFYFGSAWGQVKKTCLPDDFRSLYPFGRRILDVMVQGTVARDVNMLRDHIMKILDTSTPYEASNDLNPKPKPSRRWRELLRSS